MSQENVEIVRRIYDAVERQDSEVALALYDPRVEYDFSSSPFQSLIEQTIYEGHEGVRAFFRERYQEAWAETVDHLEEIIEVGDQVVGVVTTGGRGRVSGVEVEHKHAGLWSFRDGLVTRVAWYSTRDEALEAAGLAE